MPQQIGKLLLAFAIPVWLVLFGLQNYTSIFFTWNQLRLAPSCAVAKGVNIYITPGNGLILSGVNAPIQPIVYLPAVLLGLKPGATVQFASFIASLLFFGSLLVVFCAFTKRRGGTDKIATWLIGSLLFLLPFLSEGLVKSAFLVHADAPALGFSALGLAVLIYGGRKISLAHAGLASFLMALGGLAKITLLPLWVLAPVWLFAVREPRRAIQFALCLVASIALIIGAACLYFGAGEIYHTVFESTFKHPWVTTLNRTAPGEFADTPIKRIKVLFGAWDEIFSHYYFFFLFPFAYFLIKEKKRNLSGILEENLWLIPLFASFLLLPSTLMGRVKVGGELNTQSPTLYFLFLAFGLALYDLCLEKPKVGKSILNVLSFGVLLLAAPEVYKDSWVLRENLVRYDDMVYDYSKKHPGETYFPEHSLAVCLAEGKPYHSHAALSENAVTPFPPPESQVRAHIPANMTQIAFNHSGRPKLLDWLTEYSSVELTDPALPGWWIYRRQ